jgi:hypothetical protein
MKRAITSEALLAAINVLLILKPLKRILLPGENETSEWRRRRENRWNRLRLHGATFSIPPITQSIVSNLDVCSARSYFCSLSKQKHSNDASAGCRWKALLTKRLCASQHSPLARTENFFFRRKMFFIKSNLQKCSCLSFKLLRRGADNWKRHGFAFHRPPRWSEQLNDEESQPHECLTSQRGSSWPSATNCE